MYHFVGSEEIKVNINKSICILIAVLTIIGFTSVVLVANGENKQGDIASEANPKEGQRETVNRSDDNSNGYRTRELPDGIYPSMHPPEDDPGASDDPIQGDSEDTDQDK